MENQQKKEKDEPQKEEDQTDLERAVNKRKRIIDVTKNGPYYVAFNAAHPTETRCDARLPATPDAMEPCSKRRFDTKFIAWKSMLKAWVEEHCPEVAAEIAKTARMRTSIEVDEYAQKAMAECPKRDPRHYSLSVCCRYQITCSCLSQSHAPMP
jgi:hypothetical protein